MNLCEIRTSAKIHLKIGNLKRTIYTEIASIRPRLCCSFKVNDNERKKQTISPWKTIFIPNEEQRTHDRESISLKAYTCQLELMCGTKIAEIFSHLVAVRARQWDWDFEHATNMKLHIHLPAWFHFHFCFLLLLPFFCCCFDRREDCSARPTEQQLCKSLYLNPIRVWFH